MSCQWFNPSVPALGQSWGGRLIQYPMPEEIGRGIDRLVAFSTRNHATCSNDSLVSRFPEQDLSCNLSSIVNQTTITCGDLLHAQHRQTSTTVYRSISTRGSALSSNAPRHSLRVAITPGDYPVVNAQLETAFDGGPVVSSTEWKASGDRLLDVYGSTCSTFGALPERRVCTMYRRTRNGTVIRPVNAFMGTVNNSFVEVRRDAAYWYVGLQQVAPLFLYGRTVYEALFRDEESFTLTATGEVCRVRAHAVQWTPFRMRRHRLDELHLTPFTVGDDVYQWNRTSQQIERIAHLPMVFSDRYFVTPTPVSLPAVVDAWFPSAPSSRLLFKLKAPRGASTPLGTIEAYDPATLTGSAFVDIAVAQEFSNTPTGLLCECIAGVDCTTDCAGTPFQPGAVGEVYVKQSGTDRLYLYKRESALFDASGPFSLECEVRNLSIPYGDVYTWTGSLDGYDDLVFFSDLADPREAGLPYLCGGPVVENLDAHLCGPLDNETGRLWPRVIAPSLLFSLTHDVVDQVQCFADDHLQTTLPFSACNNTANNGLVLPDTLPLVALAINDTDFTNSLEVNGQDVDVAFGAASRRRRLQELYANIINVYYVLSPLAGPPPPPPAEAPPSSDMQTIVTAVASSVGALVLLGIVYLLNNPKRVEGIVRVLGALTRYKVGVTDPPSASSSRQPTASTSSVKATSASKTSSATNVKKTSSATNPKKATSASTKKTSSAPAKPASKAPANIKDIAAKAKKVYEALSAK